MSALPARGREPLTSPHRLADLEASGLLDSQLIGALEALTQVAHSALGMETTALVTAITADSQVVVSAGGLLENDLPEESMPLSHSMCKYVVAQGQPLVVEDLSRHTEYEVIVRDLGVGSYVGFPLHGPRGTVLGAVCAVTPSPREWTPLDLQILRSLTTAAEFVVAMLAMARRDRLEKFSGVTPVEPFARIQHGLRTPLASLLGFLELLLDGSLGDFSADQVEALRRCEHSALRLRETIEGLLPPEDESR